MTPQALLRTARQQLIETGLPSEEARSEAQILLCAVLSVTRAWLIANAEQTLTDAQLADFHKLLQRRVQGEPVAYILGHREFYGLDFAVAPGVLIPRPDTETLVEAALSRIPKTVPLHILDLGTGSGAIAVAIAVNRPSTQVIAVDQSETALEIAQKTVDRLSATNLRLLKSDWFSALSGEIFDIIVSNPPYIADADPHLNQGDLRFEPRSALAAGSDGLDEIRRIVAESPKHLAPGSWLLLEHGYDQAVKVAGLLEQAGFTDIGHAADLAGIQRVTLGRKI